jgi:hypothetical protein
MRLPSLPSGFLLIKRHFVSNVILVDIADVLHGLLADISCQDQFHVAKPIVRIEAFHTEAETIAYGVGQATDLQAGPAAQDYIRLCFDNGRAESCPDSSHGGRNNYADFRMPVLLSLAELRWTPTLRLLRGDWMRTSAGMSSFSCKLRIMFNDRGLMPCITS